MSGEVLLRLLLLAAALVMVWVAVAMWERRPGRAVAVPPGVTLVVGDGCRLCPAALAALQAVGVTPRVLDVASPDARRLQVTSLPTLLVAGPDGSELWRRSGRAAVTEARRVAEVVT